MSCSCAQKDEKQQKLDQILDHALAQANPRSQLIEVLHQAQSLYGHLAPETMAIISQRLGVSLSRIYGVATFYHYFHLQPRGTYVISVCMGTACYVKGAHDILETLATALKVRVGDTTPDRMFTLLETRCLGACGLAPTMMVNDRIYGDLTPEKVTVILRELLDAHVREVPA